MPAYPLTRAAAVLTTGYNMFALARPSALVEGLEGQVTAESSKLLARTWAGRDIPVSALILAGPDHLKAVGIGLRVAGDLTDAITLGMRCHGSARTKALAVTLGWAAVNAACLGVDRRAARGSLR